MKLKHLEIEGFLQSPAVFLVIFIGVCFFASISYAALPTIGALPLPDLGSGTWGAYPGGLYPNSSNQRPSFIETAAVDIALNQIRPLDSAGNPDETNGKIVMISVGMSNTTMEFSTFVTLANGDLAKNPKLEIVDCAISGADATQWTNPAASTWTTAYSRLAAHAVTPQQVQVAWVKQAVINPAGHGAFPAHAQYLQGLNEDITRALKTNFPNIKIAYYASRTRAHTTSGLNPEPYAYESSFSVKWMIENQVNGTGNLNWDSNQGPVVAPLILWGPYLWADGENPRSDGFIWSESDTVDDKTHPSTTGKEKVAAQLKAFFKTDPSAAPWFLNPNVTGQPPTAAIIAEATAGPSGTVVNFTANASDPDGAITEYQWTYDDGCFSTEANPAKSFPAEGLYKVHLTVTDNQGNAVTTTKIINVNDANPLAQFTTDVNSGLAPLTVNFDATSSTAGDATIVSYDWDFGDSNSAGGVTTSHTYTADGDYIVVLTVTDANTLTSSAEKLIGVGPLDVSEIGDLSGDEVVDSVDFAMLANYWYGGELAVDIVSDGIINPKDLKVIADNWLLGGLYAHQEPIAYYKFDEGSGNLAADSSGNGTDAAVLGATWTTGVDANALTFDGINDKVTIPDTYKHDLSTGTWSAWVKTDGNWGIDGGSGGTSVKGSATVINRHNASGSRAGLNLFINADGYVNAQAKDPSSMVCSFGGTIDVTDNQWHHVAVVFRKNAGEQIITYVDSNPDGSGTNSADWDFENQDETIADSPDNFWEEFAGSIDDVQVYNRELSTDEICFLYENPGENIAAEQ